MGDLFFSENSESSTASRASCSESNEQNAYCNEAQKIVKMIKDSGHSCAKNTTVSFESSSKNEIFQVLQELKTISADMRKITLLNNYEMILEETSDFTSILSLQKKIDDINNLKNHIQDVSQNIEKIKLLFHKPLATDTLPLKACHHKSVVESIKLVSMIIKELENNSKAIESFQQLDMNLLDQALLHESANLKRELAHFQKSLNVLSMLKLHMETYKLKVMC